MSVCVVNSFNQEIPSGGFAGDFAFCASLSILSSVRSSYMVTEGPLLLSAASDVSEYALLALGLAVRLTTPVEDFALVLVFGTAVIVDTAPVGNLSLSILYFGVMSDRKSVV